MAPNTVLFGKSFSFAKAQSPIPEHTGIFKLHLQTTATIGSATVRDSVRLPPGVPADEWIAAQMITHWEQTVHVVNLMHDICTEETCPRMSAGEHTHYLWADDKNPVPQDMCAYRYMRMAVDYCQEKMADRRLMPLDGTPFPPDFMPMVKTICKRMFRCYAHVYLHHFEIISDHESDGFLNLYFKHFLYFVIEFNLVSERDMAPLASLVAKFRETDAANDAKRDPATRQKW